MEFRVVSRSDIESPAPAWTPRNETPEQVNRRAALTQALRRATPDMLATLDELKRAGRENLEREDFLWHHLLTSMSTMGNSRGYDGLIADRSNYDRVTYEALDTLDDEDREEHLDEVLRDAKVRMPAQKARWLSDNFLRVRAMGGPTAAKTTALSQQGKRAKVAFLTSFSGIGPKYGRNIWMDVYDDDFHHAIAVDERIKAVSAAMGYSFQQYDDHEAFYLAIADDAGLEGWEVDRLLYHYRDHFEQAVLAVRD